MIDAAAQYLQTALGRLSLKSALYPFLWLCVTMTPICFIAAYYFRDYDRDIVIWLLRLGALPVLTTLLIGIGFSIFSPSRLQSEDYQIKQQSLQLLQGRHRHEVIDVSAVVAISNPALPAAPEGPSVVEGEGDQ